MIAWERHILRLMHEVRQQEIDIDALRKTLVEKDRHIAALEEKAREHADAKPAP